MTNGLSPVQCQTKEDMVRLAGREEEKLSAISDQLSAVSFQQLLISNQQSKI